MTTPASRKLCSRSAGTGSVKVLLNLISAGQSRRTLSAITPRPCIRRHQSTASAAPTRTFFGSHPRRAHVPPNGLESTTATSHPADRHCDVTGDAASPVPMTTMSNFLVMPKVLFLALYSKVLFYACLFLSFKAISERLVRIITRHDDAHPHDGRDGGRGRCKRRLRAGKGPPPLQDPLQNQRAYPRSRGQAECEEPGLEFQSANADFPSATRGEQAGWGPYA